MSELVFNRVILERNNRTLLIVSVVSVAVNLVLVLGLVQAFHRPPLDFSSLAHGIGPEAVPPSKWLALSRQCCPVRPVGMSAVFAGSVQKRRRQK